MILCVLKQILHKKKSISEIALAALIVDGYFWNSTSHFSLWMDMSETVEVKGYEKCIFETPYNLI